MTPAPHLSLGLLLTAAAGFADVVGFIELGGSYTSFMSGNTTQMGAALANGVWSLAIHAGSLVGLFFVGGVVGTWVSLAAGYRWGAAATTALVTLCFGLTLVLAYLGLPPGIFMLSLAAGAGAQNAILLSIGSVRLGTTFVTGALFGAAQDLAKAFRRAAPPWRWAQHLLVWASLMLGALIGGLCYDRFGVNALIIPALLYLFFLGAFVARSPAKVLD